MNTQIHTTTKNGLSENTADNKSIGQLDALISDALELHKSQLELKFSFMLDNADESLLNLPEIHEAINNPNNETDDETDKKNDDFEKLIRTLHSERNNIENSFFKAIIENNINHEHSQDDEQTSKNGLSLIDQDDMDEMVAVATMYTSAMNKFGEEVNNLATRFEFLEISSKRTLPKHMFDLRHICEAFQTAIKPIDLSLDHKLLLFKLFDQDVSSSLDKMYRSINQMFIDAGVLPEVVYTVKNEESKPHHTEANSSDGSDISSETHSREDKDSQSSASGNDTPGSQNVISRFISKFMSGFSVAKGDDIPQSFSTTPPDTDSDACYSQNDLMNALSKLQSDLTKSDINTASDIDAEQIKRAILSNMGHGNGGAITKTVHTLDQRRIDFVGMIFQAIADDESISMVITNLLMLLQIPIIKTAMLDEELFTEKEHPARVTLDLVTKAGRGVTEAKDRVFIELKRIVDGILHEYDVDKSSFESAVNELLALINQEEEISAENEKLEQQEIIKKHARDVVLGEMRRITVHKIVPENTRPLMLKHWPSLMYKNYMNHGVESSEWLSSLKIFNSLMEYLQPIKRKSQWMKLKDSHASLVEAVHEELDKAHHGNEEIYEQISALKQTFQTMLDTGQYQFEDEPEADESKQASITASLDEVGDIDASYMEFNNTDLDDKAARIQEQVRIAREKIENLPGNMHPGVWFEVFNGEDKPVRRLKLSVILTDVAKLIFVDRQGVKVIEKDADDFLNELNSEQSRLIADHSTFEHALGSVIHKFAS